jgi:hypothetical protein
MLKKQQGLTFMELSIALVIVTSFFTFSVNALRFYSLYEESEKIIVEVKELKQALSDFYLANCSQTPFPTVTFPLLISQGMLPPTFSEANELGTNYAITINDVFAPPLMQISLTLDSSLPASHYTTRLKADQHIGQIIYWNSTVTGESGFMSRSQELFKNFYGNGC